METKERAYAVDICRAVALLVVVLYHSWVLTGAMPLIGSAVTLIISLGGELGVTCFFLLSGYGIFYSIDSYGASFDAMDFFKKRVRRVVPQYYLSILVALLFCDSAVYLSGNGFKSIITHLFFIHNLFPECSGTINGVLWTMGVIVQFYLSSFWCYKGITRWGGIFALGSVIFTVLMKAAMYALVLPKFGLQGSLEFFSGRQLVTSLDNFVLGMYAAWLFKNKKIRMRQKFAYAGVTVGLILVYTVCYYGMRMGIHTNNVSGYTWHSFVAAGIGIILFFASYIRCNKENVVVKGLLWIAKYEYGIYIWHLLMINNLLAKSEWIQKLSNSAYHPVVYLAFIVLSVAVGYVSSILVERRVKNGGQN